MNHQLRIIVHNMFVTSCFHKLQDTNILMNCSNVNKRYSGQ